MGSGVATPSVRKTILVTGGAGYVGAHVCEALAVAGYRPVVLDNLSTGRRAFVRWGPLIQGDVWDAELVRRTLVEHDIRAVLHFAASSVVPESVRAPLDYYRNNVGGLFGLLGGMRAAGVNTLVFSSTCAVYGDPGAGPITEAQAPAPVTPYGRSKLGCEQILADASAAHGLKVVALRYFNACGASACGLIGEDRPVETHLIPRAMMALIRAAWTISPSMEPTIPRRTARRSATMSMCPTWPRAIYRLWRNCCEGRSGFAAYNLGAGRGPFGASGAGGDHAPQRSAAAGHLGRTSGRRSGASGVRHRPGPPRPGVRAAPVRPVRHRRQRLGLA